MQTLQLQLYHISGPSYRKDVLKMTFLISGTIWIYNCIKFIVSYPLFNICVVAWSCFRGPWRTHQCLNFFWLCNNSTTPLRPVQLLGVAICWVDVLLSSLLVEQVNPILVKEQLFKLLIIVGFTKSDLASQELLIFPQLYFSIFSASPWVCMWMVGEHKVPDLIMIVCMNP